MDDLEIILINDESTDERYYQNHFGDKVKQIDIRRNQNPRWTGSRQSLINIGVENANGKLPRVWKEDFLKIHNCVIKSSAVIDTEILKMIGGFRGIPKKSDYDCWLNIIKVVDLLYIDEPLFYYDGSHGSGQYY